MIKSIIKTVIVGWIAKKFLGRNENTRDGDRRPDRRTS